MKRIIFIILCIFALTQTYAETALNNGGKVRFRIKRNVIKTGGVIHRAPYHGAAVTSSYDEQTSLLAIWFHYQADDAEVIIIKDGDTIVDETFNMAANELLECDFSECENGEYSVTIIADGEMFIIGTLYVS